MNVVSSDNCVDLLSQKNNNQDQNLINQDNVNQNKDKNNNFIDITNQLNIALSSTYKKSDN